MAAPKTPLLTSAERQALLEFKYKFSEHGKITIRAWLTKILTKLMEEEDSFSSKYPFGDSDWTYDLPYALVKAKAVDGEIDGGEVLDCDDFPKAKKIIKELITEMCKNPAGD